MTGRGGLWAVSCLLVVILSCGISVRACSEFVADYDFDSAPQILTTACSVDVQGATAFVLTNHTLHIMDYSDPATVRESGRLSFEFGAWCYRVRARGTLAFVAAGGLGLMIVDVSEPAAPVLVGSVGSRVSVSDVAVVDDLAYLADGGLRIIDISTPSAPKERGFLQTASWTETIAVTGHLAVVATSLTIQVFDVEDPDYPAMTGEIPSAANDIVSSGSLLYIARGAPQFPVVDPLGSRHSSAAALDSAATSGLAILDLVDPSNPKIVGSYSTVGPARAVAVSGARAYVASSFPGSLTVIDVSVPEHPTLLGSSILSAYDLEIENGLLLAAHEDGLRLFSISACAAARRPVWVPIVAHLDGLRDSRWRSDVTIRNHGLDPTTAVLVLHRPGFAFSKRSVVDGGAQAVYEDVLQVFGYSGIGLLEIRADQPISAVARVYSTSENGSFGQHVGGFRFEDGLVAGDEGWIGHLRQRSGSFRTNISVANVGGDSNCRVDFTLFATDGRELASYFVWVNSREVWQDVEPFRNRAGQPDIGWGFAKIRVRAGRGVFVFASVIDDVSHDAITVPTIRIDDGL